MTGERRRFNPDFGSRIAVSQAKRSSFKGEGGETAKRLLRPRAEAVLTYRDTVEDTHTSG